MFLKSHSLLDEGEQLQRLVESQQSGSISTSTSTTTEQSIEEILRLGLELRAYREAIELHLLPFIESRSKYDIVKHRQYLGEWSQLKSALKLPDPKDTRISALNTLVTNTRANLCGMLPEALELFSLVSQDSPLISLCSSRPEDHLRHLQNLEKTNADLPAILINFRSVINLVSLFLTEGYQTVRDFLSIVQLELVRDDATTGTGHGVAAGGARGGLSKTMVRVKASGMTKAKINNFSLCYHELETIQHYLDMTPERMVPRLFSEIGNAMEKGRYEWRTSLSPDGRSLILTSNGDAPFKDRADSDLQSHNAGMQFFSEALVPTQQEKLKVYLKGYSLASNISDLMEQLVQSGHPHHMIPNRLSQDMNLDVLTTIRDELQCALDSWTTETTALKNRLLFLDPRTLASFIHNICLPFDPSKLLECVTERLTPFISLCFPELGFAKINSILLKHQQDISPSLIQLANSSKTSEKLELAGHLVDIITRHAKGLRPFAPPLHPPRVARSHLIALPVDCFRVCYILNGGLVPHPSQVLNCESSTDEFHLRRFLSRSMAFPQFVFFIQDVEKLSRHVFLEFQQWTLSLKSKEAPNLVILPNSPHSSICDEFYLPSIPIDVSMLSVKPVYPRNTNSIQFYYSIDCDDSETAEMSEFICKISSTSANLTTSVSPHQTDSTEHLVIAENFRPQQLIDKIRKQWTNDGSVGFLIHISAYAPLPLVSRVLISWILFGIINDPISGDSIVMNPLTKWHVGLVVSGISIDDPVLRHLQLSHFLVSSEYGSIVFLHLPALDRASKGPERLPSPFQDFAYRRGWSTFTCRRFAELQSHSSKLLLDLAKDLPNMTNTWYSALKSLLEKFAEETCQPVSIDHTYEVQRAVFLIPPYNHDERHPVLEPPTRKKWRLAIFGDWSDFRACKTVTKATLDPSIELMVIPPGTNTLKNMKRQMREFAAEAFGLNSHGSNLPFDRICSLLAGSTLSDDISWRIGRRSSDNIESHENQDDKIPYILTPRLIQMLLHIQWLLSAGLNLIWQGGTGQGKTELFHFFAAALNENHTSRNALPSLIEACKAALKADPSIFGPNPPDIRALPLEDVIGEIDKTGRFHEAFTLIQNAVGQRLPLVESWLKIPKSLRDTVDAEIALSSGIDWKAVLQQLVQCISQLQPTNFFFKTMMYNGMRVDQLDSKLQPALASAKERPNMTHIFFIDEINTTSIMGSVSELIVNGIWQGTTLPPNLIVVAAINPPKMKIQGVLATRGHASAGFDPSLPPLLQIRQDFDRQGGVMDLHNDLGVFEVRTMTPAMQSLVVPFPSVSAQDEEYIISELVSHHHAFLHVTDQGPIRHQEEVEAVIKVLLICQNFARAKPIQHIHANLRQYQPFMTLFSFFRINPVGTNLLSDENIATPMGMVFWKALAITVQIVYGLRYSSYSDRVSLWSKMRLLCPSYLKDGKKGPEVLIAAATKLASESTIPDDIALNTALTINLFVVVICTHLLLPLTLSGESGCSKSLAYQIAANNMQGIDSPSGSIYQKLYKVVIVTLQWSNMTTAREALSQYQYIQSRQAIAQAQGLKVRYVAVHEEFNLGITGKVLHDMLDHPEVMTLILSNRILDPAKASRTLQLCPTSEDLRPIVAKCLFLERGTHLFRYNSSLTTFSAEEQLVWALLRAWERIQEQQKSHHRFAPFEFQLRDFTALLRQIRASSINQTVFSKTLRPDTLRQAVLRNFGGCTTEKDQEEVVGIFMQVLHDIQSPFVTGPIYQPPEPNPYYPLYQPRTLLLANLNEKIRPNDKNPNSTAPRSILIIDHSDALESLNLLLGPTGICQDAMIIRSSRFSSNSSMVDESHAMIDQLKIAMTHGLTAILIGGHSIFGNIYNLLGARYTTVCSRTRDGLDQITHYVSVAIGSLSNMCIVHNDFKLIVVEPLKNLASLPLPFVSRFEKVFLNDLTGLRLDNPIPRPALLTAVTQINQCMERIQGLGLNGLWGLVPIHTVASLASMQSWGGQGTLFRNVISRLILLVRPELHPSLGALRARSFSHSNTEDRVQEMLLWNMCLEEFARRPVNVAHLIQLQLHQNIPSKHIISTRSVANVERLHLEATFQDWCHSSILGAEGANSIKILCLSQHIPSTSLKSWILKEFMSNDKMALIITINMRFFSHSQVTEVRHIIDQVILEFQRNQKAAFNQNPTHGVKILEDDGGTQSESTLQYPVQISSKQFFIILHHPVDDIVRPDAPYPAIDIGGSWNYSFMDSIGYVRPEDKPYVLLNWDINHHLQNLTTVSPVPAIIENSIYAAIEDLPDDVKTKIRFVLTNYPNFLKIASQTTASNWLNLVPQLTQHFAILALEGRMVISYDEMMARSLRFQAEQASNALISSLLNNDSVGRSFNIIEGLLNGSLDQYYWKVLEFSSQLLTLDPRWKCEASEVMRQVQLHRLDHTSKVTRTKLSLNIPTMLPFFEHWVSAHEGVPLWMPQKPDQTQEDSAPLLMEELLCVQHGVPRIQPILMKILLSIWAKTLFHNRLTDPQEWLLPQIASLLTPLDAFDLKPFVLHVNTIEKRVKEAAPCGEEQSFDMVFRMDCESFVLDFVRNVLLQSMPISRHDPSRIPWMRAVSNLHTLLGGMTLIQRQNRYLITSPGARTSLSSYSTSWVSANLSALKSLLVTYRMIQVALEFNMNIDLSALPKESNLDYRWLEHSNMVPSSPEFDEHRERLQMRFLFDNLRCDWTTVPDSIDCGTRISEQLKSIFSDLLQACHRDISKSRDEATDGLRRLVVYSRLTAILDSFDLNEEVRKMRQVSTDRSSSLTKTLLIRGSLSSSSSSTSTPPTASWTGKIASLLESSITDFLSTCNSSECVYFVIPLTYAAIEGHVKTSLAPFVTQTVSGSSNLFVESLLFYLLHHVSEWCNGDLTVPPICSHGPFLRNVFNQVQNIEDLRKCAVTLKSGQDSSPSTLRVRERVFSVNRLVQSHDFYPQSLDINSRRKRNSSIFSSAASSSYDRSSHSSSSSSYLPLRSSLPPFNALGNNSSSKGTPAASLVPSSLHNPKVAMLVISDPLEFIFSSSAPGADETHIPERPSTIQQLEADSVFLDSLGTYEFSISPVDRIQRGHGMVVGSYNIAAVELVRKLEMVRRILSIRSTVPVTPSQSKTSSIAFLQQFRLRMEVERDRRFVRDEEKMNEIIDLCSIVYTSATSMPGQLLSSMLLQGALTSLPTSLSSLLIPPSAMEEVESNHYQHWLCAQITVITTMALHVLFYDSYELSRLLNTAEAGRFASTAHKPSTWISWLGSIIMGVPPAPTADYISDVVVHLFEQRTIDTDKPSPEELSWKLLDLAHSYLTTLTSKLAESFPDQLSDGLGYVRRALIDSQVIDSEQDPIPIPNEVWFHAQPSMIEGAPSEVQLPFHIAHDWFHERVDRVYRARLTGDEKDPRLSFMREVAKVKLNCHPPPLTISLLTPMLAIDSTKNDPFASFAIKFAQDQPKLAACRMIRRLLDLRSQVSLKLSLTKHNFSDLISHAIGEEYDPKGVLPEIQSEIIETKRLVSEMKILFPDLILGDLNKNSPLIVLFDFSSEFLKLKSCYTVMIDQLISLHNKWHLKASQLVTLRLQHLTDEINNNLVPITYIAATTCLSDQEPMIITGGMAIQDAISQIDPSLNRLGYFLLSSMTTQDYSSIRWKHVCTDLILAYFSGRPLLQLQSEVPTLIKTLAPSVCTTIPSHYSTLEYLRLAVDYCAAMFQDAQLPPECTEAMSIRDFTVFSEYLRQLIASLWERLSASNLDRSIEKMSLTMIEKLVGVPSCNFIIRPLVEPAPLKYLASLCRVAIDIEENYKYYFLGGLWTALTSPLDQEVRSALLDLPLRTEELPSLYQSVCALLSIFEKGSCDLLQELLRDKLDAPLAQVLRRTCTSDLLPHHHQLALCADRVRIEQLAFYARMLMKLRDELRVAITRIINVAPERGGVRFYF
jgi:hypothetical protein